MTDPLETELPGLGRAIVAASEQAQIGIVVTLRSGPEWRFEWTNGAAAALLGYSPEELRARPALSVFAPEDALRVADWRERRLANDVRTPRVIDVALVTKDGGELCVRLSTSGRVVEGEQRFVDFFVAATALEVVKQRESAEARFRRLLDAAPDAIVVATADRIEYGNPAFLRLIGVADAREMSTEQHSDPSDLQRTLERVRRVLGGEKLPPYVQRVRRVDGSEVSIEIVDMLVDWGGRPAALGIGRDLSERRQLQHANLRAARLTALGALAAGVAHEINNPLAYVLLNLQYLSRELARPNAEPSELEQLRERIRDCRHGADRVGRIVRDLRALSQSEREEPTAVALEQVLRSALKMAEPELVERASVVLELEQVQAVAASADRLEQVFLNLLVNAAQALDKETKDRNRVRVALFNAGERVVVEVEDNGSGIPAEVLDRVFDPFFTTKPAGIGTGLGLAICHSIVLSFGGEITVDSQPGRGTTFRVKLPKRPAPAVVRPLTPLPPPPSPRARVLVVDDELPLATLVKRVLEDEHDVIVASTVRNALELLMSDVEFDVVLCDVLMPGSSGVDLYRELAASHPKMSSRVVFMTGGVFTERAAEFLATVTNPRLEKPFDLGQLRRLVRKMALSRANDD